MEFALSDSGCDSALAEEAGKVVSGVREHGEQQAARPEGSPHMPCSPRPVRVKARAPGAEPTVQQAHQREQNWRITAGYLSNWVFRLSINDEWLPRRRPCHISSPEDSGKLHQCCKELDWKGRGFSLPACRRPDPGALSDGAE